MSREFAVGTLNNPANVGKWIWYSWNGNTARPYPIASVTAKSVVIGTDSYRVQPDGDEAKLPPSAKFPCRVFTEARRVADKRADAARRVVHDRIWHHALSDVDIAKIAAALDVAVPPVEEPATHVPENA